MPVTRDHLQAYVERSEKQRLCHSYHVREFRSSLFSQLAFETP